MTKPRRVRSGLSDRAKRLRALDDARTKQFRALSSWRAAQAPRDPEIRAALEAIAQLVQHTLGRLNQGR